MVTTFTDCGRFGLISVTMVPATSGDPGMATHTRPLFDAATPMRSSAAGGSPALAAAV